MSAIPRLSPAAPVQRRRRPLPVATVLRHAALLAISVCMVGPFIWMVLAGFKGTVQTLSEPASLLPDPWVPSNLTDAWGALPFSRAYLNSAYIMALCVLGTLATSAMAGYAFARVEFRGARALFGLFLLVQMVPIQVTLVPFYVMMSRIGWVDSHLAIIVPAMMVNPFGVFLMRQFIRAVPRELEEAALIDGCGRWRILTAIILPNIRPGLGALAIIAALDTWNNFLMPLVLLNSTELFTVPLLLSQFQGQYGGLNQGLIMAATTISTLPMLAVFIVAQRQIINSLATSGLGGR
ncbi:MAG: carbohydrate ABC transporter permease [Actinomyces sp.]|uniref:carbohydrate ABC transporter permease n=1 Tax=Actinomyces sp. TaxID=29317 RepID=UPI0026DABF9C|nr:carbohydrate ABC transporter permease [Actinomyces sp.]MDO4242375.1 carbohydrate ABC transporter permease [Actinomyces sp.]